MTRIHRSVNAPRKHALYACRFQNSQYIFRASCGVFHNIHATWTSKSINAGNQKSADTGGLICVDVSPHRCSWPLVHHPSLDIHQSTNAPRPAGSRRGGVNMWQPHLHYWNHLTMLPSLQVPTRCKPAMGQTTWATHRFRLPKPHEAGEPSLLYFIFTLHFRKSFLRNTEEQCVPVTSKSIPAQSLQTTRLVHSGLFCATRSNSFKASSALS